MDVLTENNEKIMVSAAALDDLAESISKMKHYNDMVAKYIEGSEKQYQKLKKCAEEKIHKL